MKLKITILLTLLSINSGIGQINNTEIYGSWIKYKSEMKDGSKILPISKSGLTYQKITINNSKFCLNSDPIDKFVNGCLSYSLQGNIIKTSDKSGYEIEKISSDTLIICQKIDGVQNDKLTRTYLVNENLLFSKEQEKNNGEKNIIANKIFTPKLKSNIRGEIYKAIGNKISNLDLIGSLTIHPNKETVTSEFSHSSKKSTQTEIITDMINNSFKNWDLTNFEKFESIKIPFIVRCESKTSNSGLTYKGLKMIFFTNELNEFDNTFGDIKLKDKSKSSELFTKGVNAYSEKKYLKAADFFAESFKIDPRNVDALYNKAAAYYEAGDKENACNTWKELVDLGQTNGIELYKNNCN